jgi:hypothetical protein
MEQNPVNLKEVMNRILQVNAENQEKEEKIKRLETKLALISESIAKLYQEIEQIIEET